MHSQKKLAALWAIVVATVVSTGVSAFPHFFHRARRHSQNCLPSYPFSPEKNVSSVAFIAVAPDDQPERISQFRSDPNLTRAVLRKSFFGETNSISTNGVTLNRIGLAVYSDGSAVCTGSLYFDGGPQESLSGANVMVRVRAYAGAPQDSRNLESAQMLWQTAKSMWITKKTPVTTSLFPKPKKTRNFPAAMKAKDSAKAKTRTSVNAQRFDEITHMEVVLEVYPES